MSAIFKPSSLTSEFFIVKGYNIFTRQGIAISYLYKIYCVEVRYHNTLTKPRMQAISSFLVVMSSCKLILNGANHSLARLLYSFVGRNQMPVISISVQPETSKLLVHLLSGPQLMHSHQSHLLGRAYMKRSSNALPENWLSRLTFSRIGPFIIF